MLAVLVVHNFAAGAAYTRDAVTGTKTEVAKTWYRPHYRTSDDIVAWRTQ